MKLLLALLLIPLVISADEQPITVHINDLRPGKMVTIHDAKNMEVVFEENANVHVISIKDTIIITATKGVGKIIDDVEILITQEK